MTTNSSGPLVPLPRTRLESFRLAVRVSARLARPARAVLTQVAHEGSVHESLPRPGAA